LKLLVVSDIHGNLLALERVLEDAGEFDGAICAGDIVGYGPEPGGCVEKVRETGFRCVAGNHDHAVAMGDASDFNPHASEALAIHRRLLSRWDVEWLGRLPAWLRLELGGVKVAVYHGSPRRPLREYVYPSYARQLAHEFLNQTGADVLILGHTHIPYAVRLGPRALLNPGSVGQPRDGDPRASYMVLELDGGVVSVDHRRVEYDVGEVARRMRQLGLPEPLAARLFHGM